MAIVLILFHSTFLISLMFCKALINPEIFFGSSPIERIEYLKFISEAFLAVFIISFSEIFLFFYLFNDDWKLNFFFYFLNRQCYRFYRQSQWFFFYDKFCFWNCKKPKK